MVINRTNAGRDTEPLPPELSIDGFFHPTESLPSFCEAGIDSPSSTEWERDLYRFLLDWMDEGATILQRSSGTTGMRKDILLTKASMLGSARNTLDFFGLRPGDSALLCLPLDYIAGKMMVVRALAGGLDLILTDPSGNPPIPDRRVDFCAMVPLQVANSLTAGAGLSRIGKLIIGGAEISAELEAALQVEPVEAWATYGMAETCSQVALRRVNGPQPESDFTAMKGVGLELDERGCLAIDAVWIGSRVQTNDIVRMTGPGVFRWLGRHDNLVNSGGVKIAPEELEALVAARLGRDCAMVGLPDALLGQRLVAVFEGDAQTPTMEELAEALGPELPRKALPKEIIRIATIPRNASFKMDRRALAALLARRVGNGFI